MIADDGNSDVSIIYLNDDFGTAVKDQLVASLDTLGVNVTDSVGYASGKSSYSSQLNQAASGDPDAIAFVTFPQGFIVMAKEAFEMGLKDQVAYYGIENIKGSDVRDNLDAQTISGMSGTQPSPPTERDSFQQFISENEERFDRTPSIWEAYYFDSAMVMGLTTVAADSYESAALRDNVYELSRPPGESYTYWQFDDAVETLANGDPINYQGVSGNVDINQNGDVVGTYRRWNFADGEFQTGDFVDVSDDL
jgi:branched-chain amino acid transport system substrate-binding protein